MEFRPATIDDVRGIVAVLAANGEGHLDGRYVAHVLGTGFGIVACDGGEVVGFAATVTRVGVTHVADLFVDPACQGRRIGHTLLAGLIEPGAPLTTFSSSHPAALPLYVRSGLVPWWPHFYLEGRPSRTVSSRLRVESAPAALVAMLDHVDRGVDHDYFASRPTGTTFVVRDKTGVIGGGHYSAGLLDVLLVADGADPAEVALAVVGELAAATVGPIVVAVPGPHPALLVLLESGLSIAGTDTYCSTSFGAIDPHRRLPHGGLG